MGYGDENFCFTSLGLFIPSCFHVLTLRLWIIIYLHELQWVLAINSSITDDPKGLLLKAIINYYDWCLSESSLSLLL